MFFQITEVKKWVKGWKKQYVNKQGFRFCSLMSPGKDETGVKPGLNLEDCTMKSISFIVEKTDTGFSAYAEDFETLPVGTTGDTVAELKQNILEAANLYLEHVSKKQIAIEQINIVFDVPSFFEYYNVINAKTLSKRIGMNNTLLSQYVKGIKKPSAKQVEKILAGIKDIGKELSELELA